jgi:hypothetical protein
VTSARALGLTLAFALACGSSTSSGGSGTQSGGSGQSIPVDHQGVIAMDSNELLENVKHAVPSASSIAEVPLGAPGLRGYWVDVAGGPPSVDRGVGVVSADGKVFFKRQDGMRRVIATGVTDATVLARAAMLLLEEGGAPLAGPADVPDVAKAELKGATISAPAVANHTLTYWSYYRRTSKPLLLRSDVDLGTLVVKRLRPGDDASPVDKAIADLASPFELGRHSAIEALVKNCADPRAPGVLANAVRSHDKADTRALAARHLRTCHDKDAVPALIAALSGDADAKVRQWAADTLGVLHDPSARPALEKAARDDQDKDVRQLAAGALKKLA